MLRAVGLRGAVALDVCAMIGAGPLVTIPLVVAKLGGSVSVIVWLAGALIALCDGLVFAELASASPRAGGTYAYLREAFGARGPGRMIAFLFVWQYLFWAPLVLASGYVGFAQYAGYLVPAFAAQPRASSLLAASVGIFTLVAVWRAIPQIARVATVLGTIAVATLLVVALAGFSHPHPGAAAIWSHAFDLRGIGVAAFGAALVIVLYDYSGYADVTALGEEVIAPARTLPRSIAWAVGIVGIAYLALNLGVFTAVPTSDVATSTSVASLVVERAAGPGAAAVVTVAVLITAFASTYGLLVAAARIPFAAARDGDFLPVFARLHPRLQFPHVALATIGLAAVAAAFLPLDAIIAALTAGIALVQGVGQCIAVAVLRAGGVRAPYRIPLFPLPPLVALAGWIVLFFSSGIAAMAFGIGTLAVGGFVFLVHAARVRAWPFVVAAAIALLAVLARPPIASAAPSVPSWGHAAIVTRNGEPRLEVDGKPFFFWGGAFFYERIPPSQWRTSMEFMRGLGANTLDLYVPWNWHETADGAFDFDGHSSPRRNLREVLRLAREFNFHLIVRPGPVIRNEWRNGGYPAWLLRRPEYDMPLGDVLDGRYPATATLQNAHGDDAAAEWMNNPTHVRYAARWLTTALREFAPVADLVLAVQLDDDQGAYIDNQTVPAPNLERYLRWLEAQARSVVGPITPAFINTFQMRVPSSSPVWTMGNWYQSDADVIGDHDRTQLDVSTAMLESNARGPLAQSEFQAGWLAGAEDPLPRHADPTNTELALHELVSLGVQGIVDFPMLDTLAPFGWEAPWSNALYAWDAAIALQATVAPRAAPTARTGAELQRFGTLLASASRARDVAILWTAAAGATPPTTAQSAALLGRVTELLRGCRQRRLSCTVLAPGDARAARAARIVVPAGIALDAPATTWLQRISSARPVAADLPSRGESGDDGVTLLAGRGFAFADVRNWETRPHDYAARSWHVDGGTVTMPPLRLAARSAVLVPVSLALPLIGTYGSADAIESSSCPFAPERRGAAAFGGDRPTAVLACTVHATIGRHRIDTVVRHRDVPAPVPTGAGCVPSIRLSPTSAVCTRPIERPADDRADARFADPFEDGGTTVVLQNARLRVIITADGGARLVEFGDGRGANATDATGALRDGVTPSPPPTARDYIAPYTHDFPAGMAQRPYSVQLLDRGPDAAIAAFRYTAPDTGATFERVLRLERGAMRLIVDERISGVAGALVSRSSLPLLLGTRDVAVAGSLAAAGGAATAQRAADGLTFAVSWRPDDVTAATWTAYRSTGTLALTFAPGWRRVTYALASFATEPEARRFVEAEREWVRANPAPVRP